MELFLFSLDVNLCFLIAYIFMFIIPILLILKNNKHLSLIYLTIYFSFLIIGVFFKIGFHSNKVFVSFLYTQKWLNNNLSYAFIDPFSVFINLFLLFPIGVIYPLIKINVSYTKIVVLCFFTSFFIEFFQFLLPIKRYPELLDIVNNTFSGILGYQYYLLVKKVVLRGEENDKLSKQKTS